MNKGDYGTVDSFPPARGLGGRRTQPKGSILSPISFHGSHNNESIHLQAPSGQIVHNLPAFIAAKREYALVPDMDVIAPPSGEDRG